MPLPKPGYQGFTEVSLQAADVLRVMERTKSRDERIVARLYSPQGAVVGLYTDRQEFKMLRGTDKRGVLMADAPGVEFLKGKIPWGKVPIPLPRESMLGAMGVEHYPFSELSHVVVTDYMPSDLLSAMVKAYGINAMVKYGGLPVLGCPASDVSGLDRVKWPEGVTILAMTEALADRIAEVLFEVDVEVWDL
jgi:hypothetical protein